MNKFLGLLLAGFIMSAGCAGQHKIDKKIYSRFVGDTIHYTVWLPENYSPDQQYTSLYTFSYGASDAAYTVQQMHYLNKLHILELPPVIVINILADMDRMGYNYNNGSLTVNGIKMLDCLRKEIIPEVTRLYKASPFRTYMGQSYGACYGNYLFLHQPDLFTGYILMSPEQLSESSPPFNINPDLEAFYRKRLTYYFVASGAYDLPRRQHYASEIAAKVKVLDSTVFHFRYYNLCEAGHNNSTAMALPLALDFLYEPYKPQPPAGQTNNLLSAIHQFAKDVKERYGTVPEKNSPYVYQPFLTYIWQHKDSTGMKDAIHYFITSKSSGRQLRDFAYSCTIAGLNEQAKQLYARAIHKITADEIHTDMGPSTLITCYRELSAPISKESPQAGWDLLQKALHICLEYKNSIYIGYYPDIYFYLGQYAVNNNFNVTQGLHYLLLYKAMRPGLVDIIHDDPDAVYFYIGKGYFLKHDVTNAQMFLQQAIHINPHNKPAQELLMTIKVS